jgi:hypothetical protein
MSVYQRRPSLGFFYSGPATSRQWLAWYTDRYSLFSFRAFRFAVAAVRELCLNKCKCQQQPDEEIIMAKQQDGTWIPMDNVTTWHGPQEQQITPRSPRLAIAFGQ